MKYFTVYFEIYGKKLKTQVLARSEEGAKDVVTNKIIFHKVVVDHDMEKNGKDDYTKDLFGDGSDDFLKNFCDILGMNKRKKF